MENHLQGLLSFFGDNVKLSAFVVDNVVDSLRKVC